MSANEDSLIARFRAYHKANPVVYRLFKAYALEAWNAGRRKGSASLVIDRIRWQAYIKAGWPGDPYKINNEFKAMYARLLMAELPETFNADAWKAGADRFEGFFDCRQGSYELNSLKPSDFKEILRPPNSRQLKMF